MKEIVSQNNNTVKLIKKLKSKKYRDSEGQYVIEGENLIREAVKNNEDISLIGIKSDGIIASNEEKTKKYIRDIPEELKDRTVFFSEDVFKSLTDTVTPQSILGVVQKKEKCFTDGKNRFIILDELQDPGNVGTIIRTADAAGFTGVIITPKTADVYSPKVIRAAAGSLFRIVIKEFDDRESLLSFLKKNNIKTYACDITESKGYTDVDLKSDFAIVIGNEGNGISDFFLKHSQTINIPMKEETESLNAAIAAGIVIYESVRQNQKQE